MRTGDCGDLVRFYQYLQWIDTDTLGIKVFRKGEYTKAVVKVKVK